MYNQYIANMKTDKDCDIKKKKNEIRLDSTEKVIVSLYYNKLCQITANRKSIS